MSADPLVRILFYILQPKILIEERQSDGHPYVDPTLTAWILFHLRLEQYQHNNVNHATIIPALAISCHMPLNRGEILCLKLQVDAGPPSIFFFW